MERNAVGHLPSPDQILAFRLLRQWYGVRHYTAEEYDRAWMTVVRVSDEW